MYEQPSLLGAGVVGPSLWPGWLADPDTRRRFTAKVHRRSPTTCWYWTGAIGTDGHGRFRAGSRTTATSRVVTAHLYAYQLEHGLFADRPPSGIDLVVRHRCDEASCQNPAHLHLGTVADNVDHYPPAGGAITAHSRRTGKSLTDYPRPSVAVDTAVLTLDPDSDRGLAVLQIRRAGSHRTGAWALPGTFLHPGERLSDAVDRSLRDKAGITGVAPRQLHVFDDPTRDERGWVLSVAHVDLVPFLHVAGIAAEREDVRIVPIGSRDPLPALHVGAGHYQHGVTVFPVWTPAPGTRGLDTGAGARVSVVELAGSARVGELVLTNPGPRPVLLLDGELLEGGMQHRALVHDLILEPATHYVVPVACVEYGRWDGPPEHGRRARRASAGVRGCARVPAAGHERAPGRGLGSGRALRRPAGPLANPLPP